jgi:hypothetical protein
MKLNLNLENSNILFSQNDELNLNEIIIEGDLFDENLEIYPYDQSEFIDSNHFFDENEIIDAGFIKPIIIPTDINDYENGFPLPCTMPEMI